MEAIPAGTWATLGPWGLVSLFFAMVFFGALVPRWIHNKWMGEKDALIEKLTTALDKREEQIDKLIRQGELNVHLLEDIKRASIQPAKADRT